MIDKAQIVERVTAHRAALEDLHVRSLALFGSVARGDGGPDSDVDLLVEFDRPIDLFAFCDVEDFLADMLGRQVDLVPHDSVKPLLAERIQSEAVLVF